MNHDPAMAGMMSSTLLLLAVPFLFVVIGVIWYRQSMDGREDRFREEAKVHGRGEVEIR